MKGNVETMIRDLRAVARSGVTAVQAAMTGVARERLAAAEALDQWYVTMRALGFSRNEVQAALASGLSEDMLYEAAVSGAWVPGNPCPLPVRTVEPAQSKPVSSHPGDQRVDCPFCGAKNSLVREGRLFAHYYPKTFGGMCAASWSTPAVAQEMADLREEIRMYPHP